MTAETLASSISWEPLNESGQAGGMMKMRVNRGEQIDFVPTIWYYVFSLFFLLSGIAMLILAIVDFTSEPAALWIVGSAFTIAGMWLLLLRKIYFSITKLQGKWALCKSNILSIPIYQNIKREIAAIQVLEKNIDSSEYYELNLVYDDASRENILSESGYESVVKNATLASEVLNIPLLNNVKRGKILSKTGENWNA